jgi:hypothetical protein
MPFALRLPQRDPNKPRLTMRERLRNTAAKILPQASRQHPKGGGLIHDIDPAHSAIAACQTAWDAYGDALRYRDENDLSDDTGPAQEAALKAMNTWSDAWDAVLAIQPTTLAGAAALAAFMEVHSQEQGDLDSTDNALAAVTKALKAMAARPAPGEPLKDCAQGVLDATARVLHLPQRSASDVEAITRAVQAYNDALEAMNTAIDAEHEAYARYNALGKLIMPEELFARDEDEALGIKGAFCRHDGRRHYPDDVVRRLIAHPPRRRTSYPLPPEMNEPDEYRFVKMEPWPEAQARVHEIADAWRCHDDEHQARRKATGVPEAEAARHAASKHYDRCERDLAALRATSLQGLILKASVVAGS